MSAIVLVAFTDVIPNVTPTWPVLLVGVAVAMTIAAGRLIVRAVAEVRE